MDQTQYRKEFARYAFFNILGMLGLSCYILADTFFISKGLGANGLTALNLAIPVYSLIHGCGLMLGMGGAIGYSIDKSRENGRNKDRIFTGTLLLAAGFAAVFFAAGAFLSQPIAALMGADAAVFEMTDTYLRMILLFAPAYLLNDVMICFVRNDGAPKLAMLAMLGGSMANILLDYIFIFPLQMGIFGAVLATGLAPLCSLLLLSRHWLRRQNGFHLVKTKGSWGLFRPVFSLGFPSLVTEVSSGVVMIVFNRILLGLRGNIGVAAYGVIANLSLVVIAVFTGIAQGMQPLASKAHGQQDARQARQILRYALLTTALLAGGIYLGMFWGADPIARIFNSENNRQLQEIATSGLRIYFTAVVFAGMNVVFSTYFAATEKAAPAHAVSLLRGFFIIVPMAFVLSSLWGITGVWLAFPVTEGLVSTLCVWIFWIYKRKNRRT